MAEAILTVTFGDEVSEVVLNPRGMIIGRSGNCDIVLDNEKVSRRHARIFRDPFDRWLVQDLDSRNGIRINGACVEVFAILPGEIVTIGPFSLGIAHGAGYEDLETKSAMSLATIADDPQTEVVYADEARDARLSRGRLKSLGVIGERLASLTDVSMLYPELCFSIARIPGSAALVVRLSDCEELPQILACHIGGTPRHGSDHSVSGVPLSRRVIQAVASKRSPVTASNASSMDGSMQLTIADESRPRSVYCCPLCDSGGIMDALYIDAPSDSAMSDDFDFFQAVARQVTMARNVLVHAEARGRQELIERQLDMACQIQSKLLPGDLDYIKAVDIAARCEPAMWVGGDCCDVWELPDGRLAFALGDVCGKGLPAAMLMSNLQAALRATASFCEDLGRLVQQVAVQVSRHMPDDMYITLFVGFLDTATGQLQYLNAGHLQPLILSKDGEIRHLGVPRNLPIGPISADGPDFEASCETLDTGISLVVVSDGITESISDKSELFGAHRLEASLKTCGSLSAAETVGRIIQDAADFRGSAPQNDDVTALCLVNQRCSQTEAE
ncbi:MAG: SpoIIE family protein phosphatase [Phycisphaerae bacterium]|jgi:serine phosphatase RsbU (regulator of sigma subunit)/pSer/pThr/pTyr-binding forkhead associated (FHA) protein|nr:SpoIIE family protein phosphatase [Phycisphaerae bacterium]